MGQTASKQPLKEPQAPREYLASIRLSSPAPHSHHHHHHHDFNDDDDVDDNIDFDEEMALAQQQLEETTEADGDDNEIPTSRRPSAHISLRRRTSSDVILIDGVKKLSATDVVKSRQAIEAKRRMTDRDIQEAMHSARPKVHEQRPPSAAAAARAKREEVKEEEEAGTAAFTLSKGLTTAEADALREKWGPNALEEKSKSKLRILYEQFFAPMPCMIWAAIVIEMILANWVDVVVLFCLQCINGFTGFYETVKAGNAVAALKASLKPSAHVNRDGKWQSINSELLVPGDLVMLGAGSAVPADCVVHGGQLDVDQSALTGESLPVTMGAGDEPKMGSTVTRGEVEATVKDTGMHTFFGKTASMIQSVEQMSSLDRILLGVVIVLLSISMVGCLIMLIYLLVKGEDFKEALTFVVVLLVASIPVAMEVVVVSTMALGSRKLAAKQAIVANLPAIEALAGMNMLCSDKTGTLTMNKMVIQEDCPRFVEDLTREDVILHAALAAKWREPPRDALDTMVLGVANLDACDDYEQLDYLPFDPTIKRTEATLRSKDGQTGEFKVTKGAPHIVLGLCHNMEEIHAAVDLKVIELAERGIRSLAVARTDEEGKWHMLGILTFLDPPRLDTKDTIHKAMAFGVDVKMITGDHTVIAKEIARQLDMGTKILGAEGLPTLGKDGEIPEGLGDSLGKKALTVNGFAQVFPEHKFLIVEALRQVGCSVGMTGDGVNDAPALKKADVGIAVQGATDAARASADIILTAPGLGVIIDAIVIAREIFTRIKNFVIYRVACTLQLLFFFFIAVLFMHPEDYNPEWPQFWTMPVLALILITVLNDGTIISIAYDNAKASKHPESWNMRCLYIVSSTLGFIAMISSIVCLEIAYHTHEEGSFIRSLGIEQLEFDQIVSLMYLKISLSDFLTLFSARCRGPFWQVPPGKLLCLAFFVAVGSSTLLSVYWPFGEGMSGQPWGGAAFVWVYCLVWFLVQDLGKVAVIKALEKWNVFGYNNINSHVEQHTEDYFIHSKHPKALAKRRMERHRLGGKKKMEASLPEPVPEEDENMQEGEAENGGVDRV